MLIFFLFQVLYLFVLLSIADICSSASVTTPKEEKEELEGSETKDGKLEIIKKIKRINSDGSYTIGYEADDGSFKIESRDVLGHIKGTYGFVDENGEIKRVSYTTSNASETVTTQEAPTVVQRIPARNRTTTKRPHYFSSTFSSTQPSPTTTNSFTQSLVRRRGSSSSTTTPKPSSTTLQYDSTTATKPNFITYTSAAPRILLQGRPSQASINGQLIKSEGQLVRPEIVTVKPTEAQVNTLTLKRLEIEKPVHEVHESEHEVRSNILRRQLSSQSQNYDMRNQLQQSLGHDSSDIYTNSMSTSHPKPPLFTTTSRPVPIAISTTPFPLSVASPVVAYPDLYQRRSPQGYDPQQHQGYAEEVTTPGAYQHQTTPTAPVVQIPPNRIDDGKFVALRLPSQRDTIFVPLSQIQGKLVQVDQESGPNDAQELYLYQTPQQTRVIEIEQQKAIVRRLPSPSVEHGPVKIDNGNYMTTTPQQTPVQYIPVSANGLPLQTEQLQPVFQPSSRYVEAPLENDIENIQSPVSTRDFQKLLHQLILRQSRLEKVSMLVRHPEIVTPQTIRPAYRQQIPYFYQKTPDRSVAYLHDPRVQIQRPIQEHIAHESYQKQQTRFDPQEFYIDQYDAQAFRPNRRVARLQPALRPQRQSFEEEEEDKKDYLPPDVREMLLLKMLQLAINPALPINENDIEIVKTPGKKKPQRNVEILGEELDVKRRSERVKRLSN